jgi:regulatory protein
VRGRGRSPSAPRRERKKPNESAYDTAVRYLGPRPRSVLEVRRHLAKKRYDEHEVAEAIGRLRDRGYVDDSAFARYWLEQRDRYRPKGPYALRSELRAKGVTGDVIDSALAHATAGRDEADSALAAIQPRLARWRELSERERKAKAQAFLAQRGFSFEVIEDVLARL